MDGLTRSPELFALTSTLAEEDLDTPPDDELMMVDSSGQVRPILVATGTIAYFDIPQVEDERVDHWVEFLSHRGRRWFSRWLARSTRYVPIFWQITDRYQLPRDVVFLGMVESGFSPHAYSWAHAAGPWQFMPATGRRYGLKVGFWLDERRDFVKSTDAAARYLSDLYRIFDDWHLAFAAYNAGPGKVRRALRRMKSDSFWEISKSYHLRRETKHYVPKILAAARISKEPNKFGFESVPYQPELKWQVVTVTIATSLETLSKACGGEVSKEELSLLNPELRCKVSPPGHKYPLRVPDGLKETCLEGLNSIPAEERTTYRYALLKEKDSLKSISQRYGADPKEILRFNDIDEAQLVDFQELVIPLTVKQAQTIAIVEPKANRFRPGKYGPDGNNLIMHRVRSGDSLWKISRKYRVSLKKLRLWNGLWRKSRLRIGQRLRVYTGRAGAPGKGSGRRTRSSTKKKLPKGSAKTHRVRSGESLWIVAQRYGTTVETLRKLNRLKAGATLSIGQILVVK